MPPAQPASGVHVGIQIGATTAPNDLTEVAREAERIGYGEIWLAEDYFQLGGIASVANTLASTDRIAVGLGVVAAAVRHPAATAMEFATLGEMYPGRFMAGLGHGAGEWVRQMGLSPKSPMRLLRESTHSIRKLLEGAEVSRSGEYFSFDRVRLHHSPTERIPLYLGVHGPASLRLSGELGDGTLLGWFSSPGYVAWARERINEGRARADRKDRHRLVVLCLLSISDEDPAGVTRELASWIAPMLSSMVESPQLKMSEEGQKLLRLIEADHDRLRAEGPPEPLLGEFVAAGDPASCRLTIERLFEAGADQVVLVPNPAGYRSTAAMLEQIRMAAVLVEP